MPSTRQGSSIATGSRSCAGYRYMEIGFEEEDARAEVETQVKLGGFIGGVKFRFGFRFEPPGPSACCSSETPSNPCGPA